MKCVRVGLLMMMMVGWTAAAAAVDVVVGVIMLWALCVWSLMGYFNRVRYVHIHIGALYWHFVDAIWLVVFFTFYLTPLFGLKS